MIDAPKLSQLLIGESATIAKFNDNFVSLKLMEMGCMVGESFVMERVAPFGDPIIIKISGYLMTMRRSEADTIEISRNPSLT
ncbi:MAG: ferrous iron transport protein A [Bacteroidetes bacterium]|nr:ferrous iron transport protein A [Bacteroidota bacterium]